jgi:hypothetical protein
MSERWKYQIKMGGIWGVFMTVFNVLYIRKPSERHTFFILKHAYILVGIFVLGYWKSKQKKKPINFNYERKMEIPT